MNPKQKKFLVVAGIVLAIVYFAPSYINYQRRLAFVRAQIAARQAKPSAGQSASPLPASGIPTAAAEAAANPYAAANVPAQLDAMLGVWQGMAALPNRGMCTLKLEMRRSLEPGQVSGFPLLVCMPVTRSGNPNQLFAQMTPAAAVLTGTAQDGGLDFHVDRIISKGASNCELTSLTVTPFGSDQLAAEWKETACDGGQILLSRLRQR